MLLNLCFQHDQGHSAGHNAQAGEDVTLNLAAPQLVEKQDKHGIQGDDGGNIGRVVDIEERGEFQQDCGGADRADDQAVLPVHTREKHGGRNRLADEQIRQP